MPMARRADDSPVESDGSSGGGSGGDARPDVWVGHVSLPVSDIALSSTFWQGLGMREVVVNDTIAVLELRGGTHLVLHPGDQPAEGTEAPFDIMVSDLDATHERFLGADLDPTDIKRGGIHDSFTLVDPDGYVVTITSSHVVGVV